MKEEIINLILKLSELNIIYTKILKIKKIGMDDQIFIYDFCNEFNNLINIEGLIIKCVSDPEKEQYNVHLKRIRAELELNIKLYKTNIIFLDNVEIKQVFIDYISILYEQGYLSQQENINYYRKEYMDAGRVLEDLTFKDIPKYELQLLWDDQSYKRKQYHKEKVKLDELYDKFVKARGESYKYYANNFENVAEFGDSMLSILEKYLQDIQQSSVKNENKYFDMDLILDIHKLCNGKLCSDIEITDFYKNINIESTNDNKLYIKKKWITRTYFLIHRMEEFLIYNNIDGKTWSKEMLKLLQLKVKNYNSNYPISAETKNEIEFVNKLDYILKIGHH